MTTDRIIRCILVLGTTLCLWITGCATPPCHTGTVAPPAESLGPSGWWDISFQIDWPEGENPAWHVDLVLAHRVMAPVLETYREEINLWRFHRRAVRDDMGHRFTFFFYCAQDTAQHISRMVATSNVVHALKMAGVIDKFICDISHDVRPDLGATSDRHWSDPIQKAWPYYIMGVSKTWLQLIDAYAPLESIEEAPVSVEDILARYREIGSKLNRTWREEGGHAFLHHLNALFGYEEVLVFERRRMTF